jgi:hypothetical protein
VTLTTAASRVSPRTAFFVNSALAFACAELIDAVLHEAGHGLAAQALGFSARIYAFYEDNATGNTAQTLIILAAGPLASLLTGAAFLLWYRATAPRYSFGRLLLLWLGLLGVMTFVNYLVVTPWLAAGDTAQFAGVLGWGIAARYGMSLLGVVLVVAFARPAADAMFRIAPNTTPLETLRDRRRFIIGGFYLPLVAGIALTALAGIGTHPVNVFYGLLGTFGNIDIVAAARYAGGVPPRVDERASDAPLRIEPAGIALFVALVLVYVFAFSHGVPV